MTLLPTGGIERSNDAPSGVGRLTPAAIRDLRALVLRERLLGLKAEYGRCLIEGRIRRIRVTLDDRTRLVTLCDLTPTDGNQAEHRALLRVWYGTLGYFAGTPTVTVEDQDKKVLATPQ